MKKVLIITYYWPPSGGSGVQRCLKFAGYLRQFGWEPVILTVKDPNYPIYDNSLVDEIPSFIEVLKVPAWEPYRLYHFFTGKKKKTNIGFLSGKTKNSFAEKISLWIRGNLFIPDGRKYWIKPAVKFLDRYLRDNNVDCIFSSGPPHSAHIIAKVISRKHNLPWIADFRDPWTGVYYFNKLMLSDCAIRRHKSLENTVLNSADAIVVVGETMKKDFQKITGKRIEVIHNGFDEKDYQDLDYKLDKKFSIAYTGMFFRDQNPPELWEVLKELIDDLPGFKEDLQLKFTGKIDALVLNNIEKSGLSNYLVHTDYVDHSRIPEIQSLSQLLLLCINRVDNAGYILTGKVFEYLAAKRPILAICPLDSDIAGIIRSTKSGTIIDFDNKKKLKEVITAYYNQFKSGGLHGNTTGIEAYSRLNLTSKLATLLDQITG
jgi:glycosyltransferase involved in cell wall biosynthesis